ncbi:hypothetical protein ABZ835_15745 [Streptomyces sp. NPDC047461]|uniref:hypothetical protein n=1 Tax=Streptomyces sp. NPDC047461 TaxID=3155619 RepID=UPI0033E37085
MSSVPLDDHERMLLPPGHEKTELIEVVRITDPIRHMSSPDLVGDEVAIWEAARVTETLESVGALPDSPLMRCFFPGWGIRAHSAAGLLFQVAFCFQCHGARLWGPSVPDELDTIHGFDADSMGARGLLARFRAAG